MGLLSDYLWFKTIKAESDLVNSLNGKEKKSKSRRRKSEDKTDSSKGRHMGMWDFLYQQIQDEKKEQEKNPQSTKDIVKLCLQYLAWLVVICVVCYLLIWGYDLLSSWGEHFKEKLMP